MTKKEIIENLAMPAQELSCFLGIDGRALITLVIANTLWLSRDKKFFDFKHTKKVREVDMSAFEIYNKFIDDFNDFNDFYLKKNRNFRKGWANRRAYGGFLYGLMDAGIIERELVDKSYRILKSFSREEWEEMLPRISYDEKI